MIKKLEKIFACVIILIFSSKLLGQNVIWFSTTENNEWQKKEILLQKQKTKTPLLRADDSTIGSIFKAWGTCFNELGWDALKMLPKNQQETVLSQLFSVDGDLRFNMGRFSMNANDYARDWYSCNEVSGDFQLKHFNIDRDRTTLIPFIKAAQKHNPNLTFWISPWSPPSWMKINQYYSVRSDEAHNQMSSASDIALFENREDKRENVFPKQLTVNDYFIQDPRYLKSYANYFCKFISAYKELDIPITMAMFQNEAWSYTNYPGCAWTPEGIIRFNVEYLAPALKDKHPEVALYLGTINTNRYDEIDKILSDSRMEKSIKGIGFQWEGREILPRIRHKYPDYKYVQTESECGWGSFDWQAAEHTFHLINEYLGNGCEEYTFWNAILFDDGVSGWGWKQNSLIRVDSKTGKAIYTPEYYAVKHYTNVISPGSELLAYKPTGEDRLPIMIFRTQENRYIIVAGNLNKNQQSIAIEVNNRYLNADLQAHSFNTFLIEL